MVYTGKPVWAKGLAVSKGFTQTRRSVCSSGSMLGVFVSTTVTRQNARMSVCSKSCMQVLFLCTTGVHGRRFACVSSIREIYECVKFGLYVGGVYGYYMGTG